MHELQQVAADKFFPGIAKHPAQRRVHLAQAEIRPGGRLAERALFEHAAKTGHALAQRALHPPPFGDIADMHLQAPGIGTDVDLDRYAQNGRSRFAAVRFPLRHDALQHCVHVRARESRE
jgi:hypothetical protein